MNCTKLIQYENRLYKIKTQMRKCVMEDLDDDVINLELDQVIRALIASTLPKDSCSDLTEMKTDVCLVTVASSVWKAASKLKFKQNDTELETHKYMYTLNFNLMCADTNREIDIKLQQEPDKDLARKENVKRKLISALEETENVVYEIEKGQGDGRHNSKPGLLGSSGLEGNSTLEVTNSGKYLHVLTCQQHDNQANQSGHLNKGTQSDGTPLHTKLHEQNRSRFLPVASRKRPITARSKASEYTGPLAKVMRHRDRETVEQEQLEEDLKLQQMASTSEAAVHRIRERGQTSTHRRSIIQMIGDLFMTPVRKLSKPI